jgi:hypothetical protein
VLVPLLHLPPNPHKQIFFEIFSPLIMMDYIRKQVKHFSRPISTIWFCLFFILETFLDIRWSFMVQYFKYIIFPKQNSSHTCYSMNDATRNNQQQKNWQSINSNKNQNDKQSKWMHIIIDIYVEKLLGLDGDRWTYSMTQHLTSFNFHHQWR